MYKYINWIATFCAGIYMILNENAFYSKFHIKYPENLYFGCTLIIFTLIGVFIQVKLKSSNKNNE